MESPADQVVGGDPTVIVDITGGFTPQTGFVYVARCRCCTWADAFLDEAKARADAAGHHTFGHPAWRNPELTCQATPNGDHERWCVRPKGHEGSHWTPTGSDGVEWG